MANTNAAAELPPALPVQYLEGAQIATPALYNGTDFHSSSYAEPLVMVMNDDDREPMEVEQTTSSIRDAAAPAGASRNADSLVMAPQHITASPTTQAGTSHHLKKKNVVVDPVIVRPPISQTQIKPKVTAMPKLSGQRSRAIHQQRVASKKTRQLPVEGNIL